MRHSVSRIIPTIFTCWLLFVPLFPGGSILALQQNKADTTEDRSRPAVRPDTLRSDTLKQDTTQTPRQPPSARETPGQQVSGQQQGSSSQDDSSIDFQARDSLIFNFEGDREARLYGSAQVSHSAGKLTAGKIILNLDQNTIRAETLTPDDTASQPVLQREDRKIRSDRIHFNYATEKGRFDVASVSIQQGKLTGNKVKKAEDDVIYIEDGIYSTCTLPHPHYYLKADRMKVVNREEIFFTNARLYLLDIPYPAVFPFGYVPAKIEKKQSGILEPTYAFQNQESRGIGLQNLGWFQYFNDYLTGQINFNIYTSGTFLGDIEFDYAKRNDFSGSVSFGYSREANSLEKTDPNFQISTNKRFSLNHNQDFSPYASMSANINLRTADYYQRNSFDPDERGQTSTTSRFSYNYNAPSNNYSLSISGSQSQDFSNNTATFSAPNITFKVNSFSPFQNQATRGAESKWYENISIGYSNRIQSDFSYQPERGDTARYNWFEALLDPEKYREATDNAEHYRTGMRHNGSISLNNLLSSQYYNTNLNFNLTEYWYPSTIRKSYDPDTTERNPVDTRRVQGISTAREFNTGFGLNTTIYGIWNQNIGNLESFRHTLEPRVSFNYRPDFSDEFWGYYRRVQRDSSGRTQLYSIYENGVVGGPGRGEQRNISFNLRNTFEARQVKRDTTGEKKENTIQIIDDLDANISYNFAADSLKFSDLDLDFSTNIRDFSISSGATFNLYDRNAEGQRVDRLLFRHTDRMAQLTNFSLRIGTRFSSEGLSQTPKTQYDFPRRYDPYNQTAFRPVNPQFNRKPVSSFDAPWSFSLRFTYSWRYNSFGENRENAILNLNNIQFRLTPKWQVRTSLGYDFVEQELTPTRFSLNRQLHMWDLSFQMNPFGDFQFYMFSLRINNSQLQSLFQKLPILKNLERSSGELNRGSYNR